MKKIITILAVFFISCNNSNTTMTRRADSLHAAVSILEDSIKLSRLKDTLRVDVFESEQKRIADSLLFIEADSIAAEANRTADKAKAMMKKH